MNARCTILSVVLLAGCGGDGADSIPPTVPVRELPQPALRMIAPTAIRVGEEITIFGKGGKTRTVLLSADTWQELIGLRGGV